MKNCCNKIASNFLLLLLCFSGSLTAQDLGVIKGDWQQGELARAKEAVDNYTVSNPDTADGWLLKARIYNAISNDARFKELVADSRMVAFKAVEKAAAINQQLIGTELDKEDYKLVFDIYKGYTSDGITFFNAGTEKKSQQDYGTALGYFKKAAQVYSFVYRNGWTATELDKDNLYYSSLASIYADKQDEAYLYCKKIADNNIVYAYPDKDFEPAYQWLVFHLKQKKNTAALEKYTSAGMKNFPQSPYFALNYIDWLRENKRYEEMFSWYRKLSDSFPGYSQYHLKYLEELATYVYTDTAQQKGWSDTLQAGLLGFVKKYPDNAAARLLLAKFYINQAAGLKNSALNPFTKNSQVKKLLERSSLHLKFIAGNLTATDPKFYQEALKLLISNLTLLNLRREADKYRAAYH